MINQWWFWVSINVVPYLYMWRLAYRDIVKEHLKPTPWDKEPTIGWGNVIAFVLGATLYGAFWLPYFVCKICTRLATYGDPQAVALKIAGESREEKLKRREEEMKLREDRIASMEHELQIGVQ